MKKLINLLMVLALVLTGTVFVPEPVYAAEEPSAIEITMVAREQKRFWVPGEKKEVKWSSSDKNIATVTKKGIVKAQNAGSTVITAKGKNGTTTWNLTVLAYLSDETAAVQEIAAHYGRIAFAYPDSVILTKVQRGKYKEIMVTPRQNDFDYRICYTAKNTKGVNTNYVSYYSTDRGQHSETEAPQEAQIFSGAAEYTLTDEEMARMSELMILSREGKYSTDTSLLLTSSVVAIRPGDSYTISVKNTDKKASWKSSKKSIVSVKNGVITAKRPGKAKITAKVEGTKLICEVYVLDSSYTDDEMAMLSVMGNEIKCAYAPEEFKITGITMGQYQDNEHSWSSMDMTDYCCAKVVVEALYNDDKTADYYYVAGFPYGATSSSFNLFSEYPGTDTRIYTQEEIDKVNDLLQEGAFSGTVVYPIANTAKTVNIMMTNEGTVFVQE